MVIPLIYNKSTGFTLLEMLVVVVIIALLSLVALPAYQSYVIKTNIGTMLHEAEASKAAVVSDYYKFNTYINSSYAANTTDFTTTNNPSIASIDVASGTITVTGSSTKFPGKNIFLVWTPSLANNDLIWNCTCSSDAAAFINADSCAVNAPLLAAPAAPPPGATCSGSNSTCNYPDAPQYYVCTESVAYRRMFPWDRYPTPYTTYTCSNTPLPLCSADTPTYLQNWTASCVLPNGCNNAAPSMVNGACSTVMPACPTNIYPADLAKLSNTYGGNCKMSNGCNSSLPLKNTFGQCSGCIPSATPYSTNRNNLTFGGCCSSPTMPQYDPATGAIIGWDPIAGACNGCCQ